MSREKMSAMGRPARFVAAGLVPLVLAACTSGGAKEPTASGSTAPTLSAQVASADLYAGTPQDLEVGVFRSDDQGIRLLTFGSVDLRLVYLGEDGSADPEQGPTVSASYLPAPTTPEGGDTAELSAPSDARGVYQAPDVEFDLAGIWQAEVIADVPGSGPVTLSATFSVRSRPRLPAPGDRALRTQNLTTRSTGVPPGAIDSRAAATGTIPDPELHRSTIADAIRDRKPALVLFATPVYCLSQFCGPDVNALATIAGDYGNRAAFIHVEIWKRYSQDSKIVNRAAADWLYRKGDLTEPWLFLIDRSGTIADRWGPVWDPATVRSALDRALG
jgi:hypothetical protein